MMQGYIRKPFTFDRVVRLVLGLAISLVLFLVLKRLSSVLLPFFVGWLIAYMINPLVNFFQHRLRLRNRPLSVFVALLVLLIAFSGITFFLVNPVSQEVQHAGDLIKRYLVDPQTQEWHLTFLPETWQMYLQTHFSYQELEKLLSSGTFMESISKLQPHFFNFLSSTFQFLISLFVVFVIFLYVIFILIDYEKITSGWSKIIPQHYRPFFEGLFDDLT
jgi:predicted PurR-regulated permease PerM